MAILGTPTDAAQPESNPAATRRTRASNETAATNPPKHTASAAENSNPAVAARLARPISMDWNQVSFRSALEDLATSGRFDLLLDRRVDPDRLFSSVIRNLPIEQGLAQVAAAEHLGVSRLGALVYVGPQAAAARLRTLAVLRGNDVQRLPSAARKRWLTVAMWSWPRFSAPRALLEQLASEASIEITGLDRVPHDLWPAGELPPLSIADRLTLLANEFDLTYRLSADGLKAELTPLPEAIQIARRYAGGSNAQQLADQWRERASDATIKVQGTQIVVAGRVEDHERLRKPVAAPTPVAQTAADPSLVRNRLEIKELPLGKVIEGLGQRLNLKIELDRGAIEKAGISLDQPVSVNVKDATIDEVWQTVLESTGLSFERKGDVLRIEPKGK